jgi:hypothetical protein
MKINVKWSDIRDGRSAKTAECMVALALKRELGARYASVGFADATVVLNGESLKVYLPLKVSSWIRFWDRFHLALPFSFELTGSGFLTGRQIEVEAHSSAVSARAVPANLLPASA